MKNYLLFLSIIVFGTNESLAQTAGSIDLSFETGSGFNSEVAQILLQPDGKVIAFGGFTEYNGAVANHIARLNTDGSLDASFNTGSGFDDWGGRMALQDDGKILIRGEFSSYNGISIPNMIRLNSNGSIDNSFALTNLVDYISLVGLQSTGKILVRGYFDGISGLPAGQYLGRLNPDGSVDETFNFQDHDGGVIHRSDHDTIYVFNSFYDPLIDDFRKTMIELDPNGVFQPSGSPSPLYYPSPITGGGPGFIGHIYDVAFLPDERMVVAGDFSELFDTSGTTTPRIGILDESGAGRIDSSFNAGTGFNDVVLTVEVDQSEKILAGGGFNFYSGTPMKSLARLNSDGSLDNSFQIGQGFSGSHYPGGFSSRVGSLQVQPDGKIIAAGDFTSYDGITRNSIVRINGGGVTSVSSHSNQEVSVFPNPSNGHFRIDVASMEEYRVYDALGKMVCSNANGSTRMIDLSAEPSGIYTLRVKTAHGWATQKLVKQ